MDYSGSNGNQANGNDDDEEEDLENLVRHCVREIHSWKGGVSLQSFIQGGSAPWSNTFCIPFWQHSLKLPLEIINFHRAVNKGHNP